MSALHPKGDIRRVVAKSPLMTQSGHQKESWSEVRLDGGNYGKMAFQARPTHQNQATGRLRRENQYNGGAIWV